MNMQSCSPQLSTPGLFFKLFYAKVLLRTIVGFQMFPTVELGATGENPE